ncbi:MAG: hypothetical protein WA979_12645 [Pacificimonas sp.]
MTVTPADSAAARAPTPVPPRNDRHDDRAAADRFAAAIRRHERPPEKQQERAREQPAKAPQPKAQSREEQKEERSGLFSMSQGGAPHAATATAGGAVMDAAADIGAVPTEVVTPEKLGAMIDDLFMSADGDKTLMMRFNDLLSPLEGVKVTRGDNGALGLHLTANAVHMPRLHAQIERLRERLLARGHQIDDIEIETDADPAASLKSGNARW